LLLAITIIGVLIVIAGAPSVGMFVTKLRIEPENLHTLWLTMVALGGTFVGGALVQATAGAFYGMGNTKTPTKVSTVLYTLYIPIKVLAFMKFGLIGLAVSMSSYFLTNSVTHFWLLRSKLKEGGSNSLRRMGAGGAIPTSALMRVMILAEFCKTF